MESQFNRRKCGLYVQLEVLRPQGSLALCRHIMTFSYSKAHRAPVQSKLRWTRMTIEHGIVVARECDELKSSSISRCFAAQPVAPHKWPPKLMRLTPQELYDHFAKYNLL